MWKSINLTFAALSNFVFKVVSRPGFIHFYSNKKSRFCMHTFLHTFCIVFFLASYLMIHEMHVVKVKNDTTPLQQKNNCI